MRKEKDDDGRIDQQDTQKERGCSPSKRRVRRKSVLEFLKARLPASIAGNLDSIVSGGTATT